MSDIDKQRVAAVMGLKAAGYRWDGNMWVRPKGFNPVDYYEPLDKALRLLVMVHTKEDPQVQFAVQMPYYYTVRPEDYIDAWRAVRKHVGMPT